MKSLTIKLVSITFEIHVEYEQNLQRFIPFETQLPPFYTIKITEQGLQEEVVYLKGSYPHMLVTKQKAEENVIFRKISKILYENEIVVFHGLLLKKGNEGYLFTAPSGTGKTTHGLLWTDTFPDVSILNGDKPLLKIKKDGLYGYGSPWRGKENLGYNAQVRIKAICYLCRDESNSIIHENVSIYTFKWVLEQSIVIDKQAKIHKHFNWYKDIAQQIEFYNLKCNMDSEAAIISYNGMK